MTAQDTFRSKAPWVMRLLMRDFGISYGDAAAILGNLGHESNGLTTLQEISPVVKGSAGGFGWAQWTGQRRRDFEAYCRRNGFDPKSDEANYKWLFLDLRGDYASAIRAVRAAPTLDAKVKAFEAVYERAGIKHYDSRLRWAEMAQDAYEKAGAIQLPTWAGASVAAPQAPPVATPAPPVVVVNPPVNHPTPSNAAGYAAFAGMLIAGIAGFLKWVGAF